MGYGTYGTKGTYDFMSHIRLISSIILKPKRPQPAKQFHSPNHHSQETNSGLVGLAPHQAA